MRVAVPCALWPNGDSSPPALLLQTENANLIKISRMNAKNASFFYFFPIFHDRVHWIRTGRHRAIEHCWVLIKQGGIAGHLETYRHSLTRSITFNYRLFYHFSHPAYILLRENAHSKSTKTQVILYICSKRALHRWCMIRKNLRCIEGSYPWTSHASISSQQVIESSVFFLWSLSD